MHAPRSRRSLFAQRIDRVAVIAYFLGAVVPLALLAFEVQRNEMRGPGTFGWIGLLVSVAALSLGAFLALRRTTRDALARMERDQARLAGLLAAVSDLERLPDRTTAAEALLRHAGRLAHAAGAFLVEHRDESGWTVTTAAGLQEPEALLDGPLCEAIAEATRAGGATGLLAGGGLAVVGVRPDSGEPAALVVAPGPGDAIAEQTRDALTALGSLGAVALANADLRDAQRNFFAHVTQLLATALDAHLGYHGAHGRRVAQLANRVGHALDLSPERLQHLHYAALLHDLGMLKMDRGLHATPEACRAHARIGHDLLRPIRLWESSAPIVLHHHERWDGSGHPDGLAAEAIPLEARILAVCDAFDSMRSDTEWKSARTFQDSVAELRRCAGTQFDPAVVEAFVSLVEEGIIEPRTEEVPALQG